MAIKSLQHSSITDNIFYRSMLAGNTAFDPGDEFLLEEQVLSSSAASVTFSGLDAYAGVYQHLQIRYVGRSDNTQDAAIIRFNSDTTFTNYRAHLLEGDGSTVYSVSVQDSARQGMQIPTLTKSSAPTGAFGAGVIDILDPFETSKYTTIRSLGGYSGSYISLWSGVWMNTAALTSITFSKYGESGGYVTGSRFSLYGAK